MSYSRRDFLKAAGTGVVLTAVNGRRVFQAKGETVEATEERLATLKHFESDLRRGLAPKPS